MRTYLIAILTVLMLCSAFPVHAVLTCTDTESCNKAIKLLQAKLNQGQQKITQTKQTASAYQQALQDLISKLQATQKSINDTKGKIGDTNSKIEQTSLYIDSTDAQIQTLQEQLQSEIVQLYEASQTPTLAILLSGASFSEITNDMEFLEHIQTNIQKQVNEKRALQNELQKQQDILQNKKDDLSELKDTLSGHKEVLFTQTTQTNYLLRATKSQLQSYLTEQQEIQKQIAETQRKLRNLITQAHWGNDIVSAPSTKWSYNQLNYSNTLGRSPYTVHDYGCLITSMAMVATFYGHHITPAQIASHGNWFTRQGYAYTSAIASGIGLSIQEKTSVDWSVVDDQLQAGRPVIVSIYLPQVGAINNDGSSHFIVLQSKKGNSYQMQDPLGGDRSYGLNYVRSMIVLK